MRVELVLNTTQNLEAIAARLGMQRSAGAYFVPLRLDKGIKPNSFRGGWCMRTNLLHDVGLDEHVAALCSQLSDMEASVRDLGRRNQAILLVTIDDTSPAGFELKPEHLRWLGHMGIQVEVTFQFIPDEDESWGDKEQE